MPRTKFIGLLFIAMATGLTARGKGLALESLLTNDPFGASAGTGRAQTPAGPSLELHGILTEGKEQLFSLYDPMSKTAAWVKLDETGQPFVVKAYNAPQESVTVSYHGREVSVALRDWLTPTPARCDLIASTHYQNRASVVPGAFVKSETERLAAVTAIILRMQRKLHPTTAKR